MHNIYFISYLVGSALLVYELGIFQPSSLDTIFFKFGYDSYGWEQCIKIFWTTLFYYPILIHLYNLLSSVSLTSSKMMVLLILTADTHRFGNAA